MFHLGSTPPSNVLAACILSVFEQMQGFLAGGGGGGGERSNACWGGGGGGGGLCDIPPKKSISDEDCY